LEKKVVYPLEEVFALIRETTRRVLGLRHFDVQLVGGLVLTEGKIAEMRTGEGKTIVALLPTIWSFLENKNIHVITVNDYLAKRDAEYVSPVHHFLGLSVGLIQAGMSQYERRKNYNCDIVYVTNNELGFDYLFDNMVFNIADIVQQPFCNCVIDEVDSVLIDEARTPLIVSGPNKISIFKYLETTKLANRLKREIHYKVDEKNQTVVLTKEGAAFCEKVLCVVDLYDSNEPWIFYILNSIRAKELFKKNKNYIIDDNKIVMIDEFTGRVMLGRRWSDGLQQAIEAKENLSIELEKKTLASISYQSLFLRYKQISGMTGTAKTEKSEFKIIYNLSVISIPTNKPIARKDLLDLIYKNQYTKWCGITQECLEMYNIGRPVLIGTVSIEKSELVASLLNQYGIIYRLLNAKRENVKSESEIVARAGFQKAITIATNMAGRGTDITLGCNSTYSHVRFTYFYHNNKYKYEISQYLTLFLGWKKKLIGNY
jgi:preprotein translocase subunit SecA